MMRGLSCEVRHKMDQPAVSMEEELTALLADSVEAARYPVRRIPSGAGHDAMVMATRVPTAMLFLRSPGGISHHPEETVIEDDVAAALKTGGFFLQRIAAKSSL
jgi:allantoate deiminase